MLLPTKDHYAQFAGNGEQVWCLGGIHPNPRFYKSDFRVYTPDSPWEGREFLDRAPRLCAAEFVALMNKLIAENRGCLIYHSKRPRLGSSPFDPKSTRWANVEFAPSWEDDSDPECDGYK